MILYISPSHPSFHFPILPLSSRKILQVTRSYFFQRFQFFSPTGFPVRRRHVRGRGFTGTLSLPLLLLRTALLMYRCFTYRDAKLFHADQMSSQFRKGSSICRRRYQFPVFDNVGHYFHAHIRSPFHRRDKNTASLTSCFLSLSPLPRGRDQIQRLNVAKRSGSSVSVIIQIGEMPSEIFAGFNMICQLPGRFVHDFLLGSPLSPDNKQRGLPASILFTISWRSSFNSSFVTGILNIQKSGTVKKAVYVFTIANIL